MALTDLMIDMETLSTATDASILTIGAVKFDPLGNDIVDNTMEKLYLTIDLDSSADLNLSIDDSTIDWWSRQSQQAIDHAFNNSDSIDIRDAFKQLYKFGWGCQRFWSNGAGFDIVICETVFKRLNMSPPWKYWQVRDVRTIFDLGIDPERPPILKHHALEDAWNQAVGVQNVCRALRLSKNKSGKNIIPFLNIR